MSDLTLTRAQDLAGQALAAAAESDIRVGVVVVDAGGHVLTAQRHEESYFSALAIAERKAYSALNFRSPTHAMMERLGATDYAIHITQADSRLTFVKGGVPLFDGERIIGALGVSGGSGDQDLACAERSAEVAGLRTAKR